LLLARKHQHRGGVSSVRVQETISSARKPRISKIGVLALTALACVGCSTGGYGGAGGAAGAVRSGLTPNPGTLDGVPAAAARTLTQRALIGWRLEGAQVFGPTRAAVYGQGPFDLKAGRGSETIDLPELAHQEPGTEHAIYLPTKVYLQPRGSGLAVLPHGKQWLSASLVGSEPVHTNFPNFVAQVEGVNPVLPVAELEWGATAAVPLGPGRQIVDHVPATRYLVTVDLGRALAVAAGPRAAVLSQAIQEQLTAAGGTHIFKVLAWVDRQGRLVQLQGNFPGTGEGTELLAISSFGAPVQVAAPGSARVIDITSLTPSGERENNGGGDTDGG
jgi:hypothetical protein